MSRARDLANVADDVSTGTVVTTASPSLGRRNLIINGAMQVAQRGTSQSIAASSIKFPVDRMEFGFGSLAQLAGTVSQSTTAPNGFFNSAKIDVTTAETSLDSGEAVTFRQKFEGQNLQQLAKGTADAQQVTLSFWVRSSQVGTYIAELYDADNTRQISKSYTVDVADTWEYKTVTFPADTTGAFDNDNNLSLYVFWWLAAGSDFTSGTLNDDAWAAATNADRVVGQTNLIGSVNDWYITGVQLEVGTVATPFEHRSYGEELALCQRYFAAYNTSYFTHGIAPSSVYVFLRGAFSTPMRASPTGTVEASGTTYQISDDYSAAHSSTTITGWGNDSWTNSQGCRVSLSGFTGLTVGRAYSGDRNATGLIFLDAEL